MPTNTDPDMARRIAQASTPAEALRAAADFLAADCLAKQHEIADLQRQLAAAKLDVDRLDRLTAACANQGYWRLTKEAGLRCLSERIEGSTFAFPDPRTAIDKYGAEALPTIDEMSGFVDDFTGGKSLRDYLEDISDE